MPPIFAQSNPPTPPQMAAWIRSTKKCLASRNARKVHECFFTNADWILRKSLWQSLRQEVLQLKHRSAMRNIVEREMGDDWLGFNEMMVAYLHLMEAAVPNIVRQDRLGFEQESKAFFEKMKEFLNHVNAAFNSNRGAILWRTAVYTAKWCCITARCTDKLFGDPFYECSGTLLGPVLKTFNVSLAERVSYNTPGQMIKKAASIELGNHLFRLYNRTAQTRLSPSILGNLNAAGLPLVHPYYSNSTLCTFFYYRGIELMNDTSFFHSHTNLQQAYDICLPSALKQRRKILIPLLTTSLIIGRFPTNEILSRPEAEGLDALFIPLCRAIQKGDFRAYRHAMGIEGPDKWKAQWWRKQRLERFIVDRTNILVFRSLLRKLWLLTCTPTQKQHIIRVDDVWTCAVALHRKNPEDIDHSHADPHPTPDPWGTVDPTTWWFDGLRLGREQIEGVVMSLLDQKMVKGYLVRQSRKEDSTLLVLGKADPFPNLYKLIESRVMATQPVKLFQKGTMDGGGGGRVVRMNGIKAIGE